MYNQQNQGQLYGTQSTINLPSMAQMQVDRECYSL